MKSSIKPFRIAHGRKIIDLDNYCTFFFVVLANRLSAGASALYRRDYGIGVVEWRCLVVLAMEDSTTAAQISQISSMNKSLVSRALTNLENDGFVEDCHSSTKRKPRMLRATNSGIKLYQSMLEDTLLREKTLRRGLTKDEIGDLLRMLRILMVNSEKLDQSDPPRAL